MHCSPRLMAGLVALAQVLFVLAQPAQAVEPGGSVAALLSQGYHIVGKQAEQRTLAGAAPYRELPRQVLVTVYQLARNGERVSCTLTYDSQRETLQTLCR